jgi:hypothetical protein
MRCRRSHTDLTRVCPRRGAAVRPNRLRSVPAAPRPRRITVHAHGANAPARLERSATPRSGRSAPRSEPAERDAEAHARGAVAWSETFAPRPLVATVYALLAERMPNIKSLVRRQDVEGLLKAASYEDLAPSSVGTVRDRGIAVRANAVLALARSGGRPPRHPAGLGDPADQLRCAAVRVLHALNEVGVLAQSLRWLAPDRSNARQLAPHAPPSISVNRLVRQSWPMRWSIARTTIRSVGATPS